MELSNFLKARDFFNNAKEAFVESRKNLYQRRDEFVKHFTTEFISRMQFEDFAIGMERDKVKFNFSYAIEREFEDLGYIYGSTSIKFGFYYGRTKNDKEVKFRYPQKFGKNGNYEEAFAKIKETLIHLVESGASENYHEIQKNKFSPMFQGKILSIYFPEKFLNVFAADHLDYFLDHFKIDRIGLKPKDTIYKRKKLQEFKDNDSIMREWSNDMFSYFLYTKYPGGPPNEKEIKERKKKLKAKRKKGDIDLTEDPIFPNNQFASFIDLSLHLPPTEEKKNIKSIPSKLRKRNYADENRRLKQLGDKGEELVWNLEKTRLIQEGMSEQLDHMKWPGKEGEDHKGYDILSFEKKENQLTEIRIEVKATQNPPIGDLEFYITGNEYSQALEFSNFYLYIVFEVTSTNPKILRIKDPFGKQKDHFHLTPMQYKASIKIK
jgi:hypothetical protein